MYHHFKETRFPLAYRRRLVERMVDALAIERSVQVAGLGGMGKSNLLRFLVCRPEAAAGRLGVSPDRLLFLHIDCNKLGPANALNFYLECNLRLQQGPDVLLPVDERGLYKLLESSLIKLDQRKLVVLVIDKARHLYDNVDRAFFSQLRGLRDEARAGRMCFILGNRRPLDDLYEMEQLVSDTCWVGPLDPVDRADFFARHQTRLGLELDPNHQELLWNLTGAHPGLLKNIMEWLKLRGAAAIRQRQERLIADLLAYLPVRRYCQQLWDDLTPDEQQFLTKLPHPTRRTGLTLDLKNCGLLVEEKGQVRLFSPLWEAFLKQSIWPDQTAPPMQVEPDPAMRRVRLTWRGHTVETSITRHLVFELLRVLATNPGEVYTKDELIQALYQDEKASDVFDDALFQLVTGLRKSVDPRVKELCPTMKTSCIQNVRGVGYRLVVELPEGG